MDTAKAGKILRVCELIAQMPSGGGWVTPSEIILWTNNTHATTYRYLPKLVLMKHLIVEKRGYRSGFSNHYKITNEGLDYLRQFKEMF